MKKYKKGDIVIYKDGGITGVVKMILYNKNITTADYMVYFPVDGNMCLLEDELTTQKELRIKKIQGITNEI